MLKEQTVGRKLSRRERRAWKPPNHTPITKKRREEFAYAVKFTALLRRKRAQIVKMMKKDGSLPSEAEDVIIKDAITGEVITNNGPTVWNNETVLVSYTITVEE